MDCIGVTRVFRGLRRQGDGEKPRGQAGHFLRVTVPVQTHTLIAANRLLDLTAPSISNVPCCRDVTTCLGVFGRLIGWLDIGRKVWDLGLPPVFD
jgi:hypothetical protein